jgi:hypothetical protein
MVRLRLCKNKAGKSLLPALAYLCRISDATAPRVSRITTPSVDLPVYFRASPAHNQQGHQHFREDLHVERCAGTPTPRRADVLRQCCFIPPRDLERNRPAREVHSHHVRFPPTSVIQRGRLNRPAVH